MWCGFPSRGSEERLWKKVDSSQTSNGFLSAKRGSRGELCAAMDEMAAEWVGMDYAVFRRRCRSRDTPIAPTPRIIRTNDDGSGTVAALPTVITSLKPYNDNELLGLNVIKLDQKAIETADDPTSTFGEPPNGDKPVPNSDVPVQTAVIGPWTNPDSFRLIGAPIRPSERSEKSFAMRVLVLIK